MNDQVEAFPKYMCLTFLTFTFISNAYSIQISQFRIPLLKAALQPVYNAKCINECACPFVHYKNVINGCFLTCSNLQIISNEQEVQ